MRFPVAAKVVAGMATVLALGTVAMLIIYDGLAGVSLAMKRLAEVQEPISAATHEMEINVNGISLGVLRYLGVPEQAFRDHVAKDERDFQRFHAQYLQLASTEQEQRLGRQVGQLAQEFTALGRDLMALRDRADRLSATVADGFEAIDAMIDKSLQAGVDRKDPDWFVKIEALNAVEADLAEVGLWLATYQRTRSPKDRDRVDRNEREFRAALARLERLKLTEMERRHVERLAGAFDGTAALIRQVVKAEERIWDGSGRFVKLRERLDDLLDDEMQVLALEHLLRPRHEAAEATARALGRIGLMIPLFVAAAAAVAFLLVRGVSGPLRRLTEGTAAVGRGDLTFRVVPVSRDEFADLADEFNRMVARLEETTVSRALLQESERKLRDTVVQLRQEILDRQRAEEERTRLQASLRRAETMSALGTLVAGVAHQVRNPLFGISSVLDAMDARFGTQPEHQRYRGVLREQLDRLTRLMQELFEYGKPPGAERPPAPVGPAVAEAVAACGPLAERQGVRVEQHLEGDAAVAMDRPGVVRALENLVENALRYSPQGGTVRVEARRVERGGRAWVECRVTDGGPGFAPADLPRVFEPFFTRRQGGTGLGLAIAGRVAEVHGGEVVAGNRPEGGAVVTVRLPAAEASTDGRASRAEGPGPDHR